MDGIAAVLGPLLTAGAAQARLEATGATCSTSSRWRGGCGGSTWLKAADVTRLFTMSVGDLLREWFETEAVQAMMAVNGVIGTWAGPEEPGTAYVMLHHSIGDVGAGSSLGQWGYPEAAWARWPTPSGAPASRSASSCAPTHRSSGC